MLPEPSQYSKQRKASDDLANLVFPAWLFSRSTVLGAPEQPLSSQPRAMLVIPPLFYSSEKFWVRATSPLCLQPSSVFLTFPSLSFHQKSWSGLAKMVCKKYWDKMSQLPLLRKNPSLLPREGIKILTKLQQTSLLNVTVPEVYW